MAEQTVTPQRVRDILSSFLYDSEKRPHPTSPEKLTSPDSTKTPPRQRGSPSESPGFDAVSPEVASNRRTFASFLKRVETFSPITWFAKPPELSPLVCSRFGWENNEYDMLHCTACSAHLCGTMPTKSDAATYHKACEELQNKLLTAHEKFCTLAVNPCPEAFLKVGLHDVEDLRQSFLQRVAALRRCAQHLPDLAYTQLETWGFAESHAAKFCAEENMSETDTPTQVITLAFTGWTVREGNQQIIVCSLCRRQVGLWNFTPAHSRTIANGNGKAAEEEDEDSSGDSGPLSKLRKIEPQPQLDPVGSHHTWCPWVALRMPSEDAMTLLPIPDNTPQAPSTPCSSSPPCLTPTPTTPQTPPVQPDGGSPGQGGGDAGRVLCQKQPAWVLVVRLVAPGLLSQSRRLVQQVKQSSIVEGLHCIRKVLKAWSSPDSEKKAADLSNLSSLSQSPS
ncbi:zinc finger C3HC-type protein 1-like [Babylonia areolata]|uniref:zinc finger C3HC-type protein 1-like n=1 Tax=Babylonia areolata TaxID=304850 RepID=UPI003FD544EF